MCSTKLLEGGYAGIPAIHGQESLLFQEFGSYQGEWLQFAVGPDGRYFLYRDCYGS